jgi:hypothetical protein
VDQLSKLLEMSFRNCTPMRKACPGGPSLNRTTASALEAENQVGDERIPCPAVTAPFGNDGKNGQAAANGLAFLVRAPRVCHFQNYSA